LEPAFSGNREKKKGKEGKDVNGYGEMGMGERARGRAR